MAALYFASDALDPGRNEELSRRARTLHTPSRAELGALAPEEWVSRLFYYAPDEEDDLVISVCGTGGVVATELRCDAREGTGPRRETYRLNEVQATVFRDEVLRADPWHLESEPGNDSPTFVAEFIESDRYACLSIDRPPAQSPERDLVQAFCKLWAEEAVCCRQGLGSA